MPSFKLSALDPKLRERIQAQIREEDAAHRALGGLPDPVRKPDQRRQSQDRQLEPGPKRLGWRVGIISLRHRELDGDNLQTGAKPLRDAIAATLGTDDAEAFVEWHYRQILTTGRQGTIVTVERL